MPYFAVVREVCSGLPAIAICGAHVALQAVVDGPQLFQRDVRHDRRPARIAGVAGVFGPAGVLGCAGVLGATWRLRSAGPGSSARLLRGTRVGCGGAGLLLHRAGVAWLGRSRTRLDGSAGIDLRMLQPQQDARSEEHTSEHQSLMSIS